jgi:hypothetical protein
MIGDLWRRLTGHKTQQAEVCECNSPEQHESSVTPDPEICPECHGAGEYYAYCEICDGTGKDLWGEYSCCPKCGGGFPEPCSSCNGSGRRTAESRDETQESLR